jgi:orotate phosphoribosyltransferase
LNLFDPETRATSVYQPPVPSPVHLRSKMEAEVISIFKQHVRSSEFPCPWGHDGSFRLSRYLDVMTASHDENNLALLARFFADWIRTRVDTTNYDAICVPKRGNVLLAQEVARLLGKKSGFVHDSILFGRWVEGYVKSGESALLIDDVASDCEFLIDAANSLKRVGVFVGHILALVERTEANTEKRMRDSGARYESCFRFSDSDLSQLQENRI